MPTRILGTVHAARRRIVVVGFEVASCPEEQGDLMIGILTDAPLSRGFVSEELIPGGSAAEGLVAKVEPRLEEGPALDVQSLPSPTSDQMVQLFKLLADDTRLQILYFLTQKLELNVGTFCDLLDQSQPAVSHHLALMRGAGLIEMRREGKHNYYRLKPSKFQEFGQVLYAALPPEARDWHWAALAVAPTSHVATTLASDAPSSPGISGA